MGVKENRNEASATTAPGGEEQLGAGGATATCIVHKEAGRAITAACFGEVEGFLTLRAVCPPARAREGRRCGDAPA